MIEVMIVDDSAPVRMSVSHILKGEGFKPTEAQSAEDALSQLKQGKVTPKLFILDLNMPGMNGIELVKHIRALPGLRFVPILMLTTESQLDKRHEAKAAGATGWLVKPVGAQDLVKVIKQVCPKA